MWRNRRNTTLVLLAVSITLIPVVLILYHITAKGIATMDWEFLTSSMPFSFRREGGGFLNGLIGTAIMVGLASAISIPLGVLAAVYLELKGGRERRLELTTTMAVAAVSAGVKRPCW